MTEPALLRMGLGLVFVIVLILVCAWLARRTGLLQRQRSQLLRQIDHLALGPRASIALIELQDTWLVVGITAGQISVLHTLPAGSLPPAEDSFPNLLSRLRNPSPPRAP